MSGSKRGLPFYKMTGSGNDFVMVDLRLSRPEEWTPEEMAAVCHRRTGVGADGVVFVGPGSRPGVVRMIYHNSDGSHAAMCGNAALCSTRLAARLELAPPDGMTLETDAGVYRARCLEDPSRAELNLPPVEAPAAVSGLKLCAGEQQAALGVVGVPHLVVLVDDVEGVDLDQRGRALRFDPALGPAGANINFVSPGKGAREPWLMRTYERGVEGETLACGTGAVASALALHQWKRSDLPWPVLSRVGRLLEIRAAAGSNGTYQDVWLSGEGRVVCLGALE
jgi:diaminopimelate epimerase